VEKNRSGSAKTSANHKDFVSANTESDGRRLVRENSLFSPPITSRCRGGEIARETGPPLSQAPRIAWIEDPISLLGKEFGQGLFAWNRGHAIAQDDCTLNFSRSRGGRNSVTMSRLKRVLKHIAFSPRRQGESLATWQILGLPGSCLQGLKPLSLYWPFVARLKPSPFKAKCSLTRATLDTCFAFSLNSSTSRGFSPRETILIQLSVRRHQEAPCPLTISTSQLSQFAATLVSLLMPPVLPPLSIRSDSGNTAFTATDPPVPRA